MLVRTTACVFALALVAAPSSAFMGQSRPYVARGHSLSAESDVMDTGLSNDIRREVCSVVRSVGLWGSYSTNY